MHLASSRQWADLGQPGQLQAGQCCLLQQWFGTDNPLGIADGCFSEPWSVCCLMLKSEVSLAWGIFSAITKIFLARIFLSILR